MAKTPLQPMALRTVLPSTPGAGQLTTGVLDAWRQQHGPEQLRQSQRKDMALSGSYTGARVDRAQLSRYMPLAGSANADTIADLPMLRSRSREQMRNAPVALGALNTTVSHAVGTGLSYAPAIDATYLGLSDDAAQAWSEDTARRFAAWAGSVDCDISRQLDFYGLQELAMRTYLESGDAFCITPRITRNGKTRLALQLIEADRICNPNKAADTDKLTAGMELLEATGEAVAVHIAKVHPGESTIKNQSWSRVAMRGGSTGRRNVLHIFKPLRPGQVRGVPWIAPIIEPLKQLARWSEAELNAAVVSGLMAVFVKMDAEAFQDIYDDDAQGAIVDAASKWSGEMESGKAVNLLPGESIEAPAPGRPNPAFDPFWQAMVRQIGMALEMPVEVLTMHFSSSYSASRAALLMGWKGFKAKRELLAKTLCQPVFELWLADEVAEGRISAPGFFADDVVRAAWCAAVWTGDSPGSIDPEKEVNAAQKRVDMGISTLQAESIAFDGVDFAKKHAQRVREVKAQKDADLYMVPNNRMPPPEPGAISAPVAQVQQAVQAQAESIAGLALQLHTLQAREPSITVNTPPVTVNLGDTHVTPPAITVEGHEINVNMPEGMVQLDAHIDTPAVTVYAAPAQVVVQPAPKVAVVQDHSYDADGNLTKSVTTHLTT